MSNPNSIEALRSLFIKLGNGNRTQQSFLLDTAERAGALSVHGTEPERELVGDGLRAMFAMVRSPEPSEHKIALEMYLEMVKARKMSSDQSVVE